eukprot:TRINITY_DN6688_c0_g1_i2.p1 TRINITY_DN6688_c0_g1~~TRINITY_DN6688_c0_g1_i2.p1  ORF type:complete len:141 (+),score=60.03 TRINITY_DN6688_c0_g1_i2:132-554(+)
MAGSKKRKAEQELEEAKKKQAQSHDGSDSEDSGSDDEEAEFVVESILKEDFGGNGEHICLVKWKGYEETSWEPVSQLENTIAWGQFEDRRKVEEKKKAKREKKEPKKTSPNKEISTKKKSNEKETKLDPVSYTHLTLPTT